MNVIRANKKLLGMLLGVALCFGMGNAISAQYSIKIAYENNPGEPIDKARSEGAWVVRVYFKPFVDWIWAGCVLMSLGGLLAVCDRRYRVARREPLPAAVEARA